MERRVCVSRGCRLRPCGRAALSDDSILRRIYVAVWDSITTTQMTHEVCGPDHNSHIMQIRSRNIRATKYQTKLNSCQLEQNLPQNKFENEIRVHVRVRMKQDEPAFKRPKLP